MDGEITQEKQTGIWPHIRILAEQKMFIFIFCASAILTSLALTYIFSEKYRSAATIVYQPQEIVNLKENSLRAFGAPLPAAPFKLLNDNMNDLMMSEATLRPVVLELGLDKKEPKVYEGPWYDRAYHITKDWVKETTTEAWTILKHGRLIEDEPVVGAIKELRERIKLSNQNSYVFNIIVADKKPERAAKVADAIAARLVVVLRDQQRNLGTIKREQLRELLEAKLALVESYQAEIEEILNQSNIASVNLETENSMLRLSALRLDREKLKSDIAKIKAKLASVSEYKAQKSALLGNNLKEVKTVMRIQPKDFQQLGTEMLMTDIELKSLKPKYGSLITSIDSLERHLRKLPSVSKKIDILRTKLDAAKRDYLQLNDAYQEAVIKATENTSEVKVLNKAVIPKIPFSPVKIYHVGLSALLSLLISIGLVYLLSYAEIEYFFSKKSTSSTTKRPYIEGFFFSEEKNRYLPDRRKTVVAFSGENRRKVNS